MEYDSAIKKNNPICSYMDGPRHYHTKQNKLEKDRHMPYDTLTCEILNMTQMNLNTKQKQTHRHREQTCGCQEGEGAGEGQIWSLGLADANHYV